MARRRRIRVTTTTTVGIWRRCDLAKAATTTTWRRRMEMEERKNVMENEE